MPLDERGSTATGKGELRVTWRVTAADGTVLSEGHADGREIQAREALEAPREDRPTAEGDARHGDG